MPKEYLFPPLVGTNRVVNLTANAAFAQSMLGAIVDLNGFQLNLTGAAGSGFFIITGPGTLVGAAALTLGATQAVMVGVEDNTFYFIDQPDLDLSAVNASLASKAPLLSPGFSGTPTAPTATPGSNTTQLATTAFVAAAVADGGNPTILRSAAQGSLNLKPAKGILDLALTFFAGNFVDGDEITIGSDVFVFADSPSSGQVQIGVNFNASVASLIVLVNAFSDVTATFGGAGNLSVTAKTPGASGNLIALAATLDAGGAWENSFLTGGGDLVPGAFVGQSSRIGDISPYEWEKWDATAWVADGGSTSNILAALSSLSAPEIVTLRTILESARVMLAP